MNEIYMSIKSSTIVMKHDFTTVISLHSNGLANCSDYLVPCCHGFWELLWLLLLGSRVVGLLFGSNGDDPPHMSTKAVME